MQNRLSLVPAALILAAVTTSSALAMTLPHRAVRNDHAAVQSASPTAVAKSAFHKASFHVGIIHSYP